MAFNLTIMSDRTGCFFCEARSCLIVWTLIGVVVNIYAIIDALILGPRGAGYTTTEIVIAVLSFILMFMLLYGAWKRQASLLKVGFYLVMILMIINLIRLIITAITYRVPPGYGWPYGSVIVSFLTSVVYLALLGWTIQRTLNEVEIRNSYGAFNA